MSSESTSPETTSPGPGPLRSADPLGNANLAPRCGAKTRAGSPCQAPAMKNGRCYLHGGKSTGPRTPEGRARMRAAHLKNGLYTRQAIADRRRMMAEIRALRAALCDAAGAARARALLLLHRAGAHPTETIARCAVPAANAPQPPQPRPCENAPCTVSDLPGT